MKKKRVLVSILAGLLACLMVLMLVLSALPVRASAKSSSEIRQEIDEMLAQQEAIQAKQDELQPLIDQNASDTKDIIAQKDAIDQQVQVIQEKVENNNDLIQSYNDLIAEKQGELDDALDRQEKLNAQYKERLRSMEENGKLSYWSILFKASSFLDLLDQLTMIREIASRDQKMLTELSNLAQEIQDSQAQLSEDKAKLEDVKAELETSQAELDEGRRRSSELLQELIAKGDELMADYAEQESAKQAFSDQIAASEAEYNQAREEERRQQEQQNNNNNNSGSSGESGGENGGENGGSDTPEPNPGNGDATSGFAWPTACRYITSPYGSRPSPFGNGTATWHTGIDIGASYGDCIYAAKSGTVTIAGWSTSGYGNFVVINHGDGSSTLYGHTSSYVVSEGEYVSQGQLIAYVGDTGNVTGPHLHFNIYIDGSTVNPLAYLP